MKSGGYKRRTAHCHPPFRFHVNASEEKERMQFTGELLNEGPKCKALPFLKAWAKLAVALMDF